MVWLRTALPHREHDIKDDVGTIKERQGICKECIGICWPISMPTAIGPMQQSLQPLNLSVASSGADACMWQALCTHNMRVLVLIGPNLHDRIMCK